MTTSGQNLTDIEEIQVWRAALPLGQEPPPPMSPQDRQLRRQLLEGQGEMLRALGSEEIAQATRGAAIVIRDDLEQWRQAVADPDSFVLWYGVRTVCCRHRESELSNVVRLEPRSPPAAPANLILKAGNEGIDVQWVPTTDTKTLVERSADGAAWGAVTDDAVKARHSLEYGMSIGPVITKLLSKAISDPDAKEGGSYYVCPVCGNIEFGSPPDKCPFCGVDASDFVAVS